MTVSEAKRIEALAKHLELSTVEQVDDIETLQTENEYSYGLDDYFVLTDKEANDKTTEYIRQTLWAFNTEFIVKYSPSYITISMIDALKKGYENANEDLEKIIEVGKGMDKLVAEAIGMDGRGHFLNGYDGNEYEVDEYFIYRF